MLSKTLTKDIEKGLQNPLYFLWSEESSFLEDALSKFIDVFAASGSMDFNYDVFDASSGPHEILDAASTLPFMAPRRLVVIKEFHKFTAAAVKVLTPYFRDPSETTCMLVLSAKAPKASLKVDWKVYSLNIRERDIPVWLKHTAAHRGLRIDDEAVECLIEFVGNDAGLLAMELEKLRLAGKERITGKDVVSSTSVMRKYTPFDLIDSLIAGRKSRSFRILRTMLSSNAMEAPVIIGTLNWHFRQFYSLWQNSGKRPLKMREKTYRALSRHLGSYKEEDFFRIFRSLHEADVGVKTSGRPELVVEVLLLKLLQTGAGS